MEIYNPFIFCVVVVAAAAAATVTVFVLNSKKKRKKSVQINNASICNGLHTHTKWESINIISKHLKKWESWASERYAHTHKYIWLYFINAKGP